MIIKNQSRIAFGDGDSGESLNLAGEYPVDTIN